MRSAYVLPTAEIDQGDIFKELPSLKVNEVPLKAARYLKPGANGRETWMLHGPDVPPRDGFHWKSDQQGERVLCLGHLGPAIVVSHECEIENDPNIRTLALIRPITDLSPDAQDLTRKMKCNAYFYLAADSEFEIVESYVDFRRLTTIHPAALVDREPFARLAPEVRKALATHFWDYLFRRVVPRGSG